MGRIGEEGTAGWQYHHGDALGSLRQLTDPGGATTLAKSYEPYGDLLSSAGDADTPYDFTGEWRDSYIKLIFLRSRYYAPKTGRFLTKDVWQGDYTRPLSLNGWNYVEANPVNFVDPSGLILDPSDPTKRGTIIHKMIQAQYVALYSASGHVGIEYPIAHGSTSWLKEIIKQQGNPNYDPELAEKYATGRADIIDFDALGLYEIKPHSAKELGVLTVNWYLSAWNNKAISNNQPLLTPGGRYPRKPGVIVGTDPNDSRKWITAELYTLGDITTGVILYGAKNKNNNTQPVPIYVFERDPGRSIVTKRNSSEVLAGIPTQSPAYWNPSSGSSFEDLLPYCIPFLVILTIRAGIKFAEYMTCGPCALVLP